MQVMSEEKGLRDLLSDEARRERRAYKRATLLVASAAMVGLAWLAYSAYKVTTLQHRSSLLSNQIRDQTSELSRLRDEISKSNGELADYNEKLKAAKEGLDTARRDLESIAAGKGDPKVQAQRAIQRVSNASKAASSASPALRTKDASGASDIKQVTKPIQSEESKFVVMPNVVGFSEEQARKVIQTQALVTGMVVTNTAILKGEPRSPVVTKQDPSPGTRIQQGTKVTLTITRYRTYLPRSTPSPM
jgi:cell division protein FtsB